MKNIKTPPCNGQAEVRGFQHDGSLHLQARSLKYGKVGFNFMNSNGHFFFNINKT